MAATSSGVLIGAQTLAESLLVKYQTNTLLAAPPPDSFMVHRPNLLRESYDHGQGVAEILDHWQADPALQAAGLLHSFVCRAVLSIEQVQQVCGERVAFLCRAYQDMSGQLPAGQPRGNVHTLRRIKFYMAAYRDPELVLLGVANLWDHFTVAQNSKPVIQRSFSFQVDEVLIPTLEMLGMWELRDEARDWVMEHGPNRGDYQDLLKRLSQTEKPHNEAFERVRQNLQPVLPQARLARKVRMPAQIYDPKFAEKTHPEWLQKLTVDIFVDTTDQCYATLRWLHHFWKPVEGKLYDCIGISQSNGYRCLQTAVIFPLESGHLRVHFHICTHEMDEINQWGLAALELRQRRQVNLPNAWWSRRQDTYAKICSALPGALPDTLYVFSPQGQLFEFHRGSTVVDYAYYVHSEVAHQTKRFKINGEAVGPTTVLRHLDLVELERDPQFVGPTRVWLHAAHTSRARNHIKQFLNRRDQGSQYGQTVFNRHVQALKTYYRLDIPEVRVSQALNKIARQLGFDSAQDLLAEIAAGRYASDVVLHPLFSEEIARQVQLPAGLSLSANDLIMAQCCKPRPGDDIVGRPHYTEGKISKIKIHQASCPRLAIHPETIGLGWRLQPALNAVVRLEVTALHQPYLLEESLQIIYRGLPNLELHKLEFVARNGMAHLDFTIEAENRELIDQIARGLETLPGRTINEVRQMQLLFSEREELARPVTPASFNPYRRLPVRDRDMLFGRSEELARMHEWLCAGVGVIFVRGQKRVGKTSLLLHLKEHYMDRCLMLPVFIDLQILSQLNGPVFFYEIANTIYRQLQMDHHQLSDIGPPLRELFDAAPPAALTDYLQGVQSHFGSTKLVLLLDEFSRSIDAFQQQRLSRDFFEQWRGILHATLPEVSYVMVVQQQTHDALLEHTRQRTLDPIWHLLEMGETQVLRPLDEKNARQLIERPTSNYLDYSPEALRYVWRLTGGSPFLIQAFCFNLVRAMAQINHRRVEWSDVDQVQAEFMNPNEGLFAHLLDVMRGVAQPICRQLTQFLDDTDQPVPLTELKSALPHIPAEQLFNAVQELTEQHILVQPEPDTCQFASLLFGRWLTRHTALEQLMGSGQGEP